jgi:hypothetical protein
MPCFIGSHLPDDDGWNHSKITDLGWWQRYYRDAAAQTNFFPVPERSGSAAGDVLFSLSIYSNAIEILRTASRLPYSRFPLAYEKQRPTEILLPHLGPLVSCCKTLQLRAVAELDLHQTAKGLEDVELLLRLANSIRAEPIPLSQAYRARMLSIGLQPIWQGITLHKWSDAQLNELESRLAGSELLADYQNAICAARAAFIAEVEGLRREHHRLAYLRANGGDLQLDSHSSWLIPYLLWMPSGWAHENELYFAMVCEHDGVPSVDVAHHRVFPAQVHNMEQAAGAATNGMRHLWAGITLPLIFHHTVKVAYMQSMIDMARLAVALERCRMATGEYPDKLEDLIPRWVEPVMITKDVMSGEELKYRQLGKNDYKLYSVGWNETDDGGELSATSTGGIDYENGDWVWPHREFSH